MDDKLKQLTTEENKNINGGRWGGPITIIIYEIVDVITSGGDNLREAFENGEDFMCGDVC
ncbi:hypothetical protein [Rhodohalobacter sp. 614A]|uniref:hypothetical protein n=1 Tax=Rhodohalobacter sp. 614A TaxID=2908649 RepID=UPI001F1E5375|nr:hypothetical protein [Rhodohalobacter sp. 614A]